MLMLVPAVERGAYEDLRLLVHSVREYAPELEIHIAYKGEVPPPKMFGVARIMQQPEGARHFGDACRFLLGTADQDELLIVNDDVVFTPWTLEILKQDLTLIGEIAGPWVGLVGMRSNHVAGVQNIRWPATQETRRTGLAWESEQQILEVPNVFGVAFYVRKAALEKIPQDWTQLHWYSDNLLSFDLGKAEYRHFVSRAYVHHHGSRSGGDYRTYDKEARAWLKQNRPDFPLP